jgi:hypothetical protein
VFKGTSHVLQHERVHNCRHPSAPVELSLSSAFLLFCHPQGLVDILATLLITSGVVFMWVCCLRLQLNGIAGDEAMGQLEMNSIDL